MFICAVYIIHTYIHTYYAYMCLWVAINVLNLTGLVSNLNESNSQSTVVQFQLAEAEKSKDKLKNHLKQMKNDKNYYREQEKSKR